MSTSVLTQTSPGRPDCDRTTGSFTRVTLAPGDDRAPAAREHPCVLSSNLSDDQLLTDSGKARTDAVQAAMTDVCGERGHQASPPSFPPAGRRPYARRAGVATPRQAHLDAPPGASQYGEHEPAPFGWAAAIFADGPSDLLDKRDHLQAFRAFRSRSDCFRESVYPCAFASRRRFRPGKRTEGRSRPFP